MLKFTYLLLLCFLSNAPKSYAQNGDLPNAMPVTDVVFMHAHNASMSTKEGWVYAQQSEDLEGLWRAGVRMIKVPIHWYNPKGVITTITNKVNKVKSLFTKKEIPKPTLYLALCHETAGDNCKLTKLQRLGKDPQPVSDLFKRLANLLKGNNEVFILKLENYINVASDKSGANILDLGERVKRFREELENSGLAEFAISLRGHENKLLTLGEMRTSGKRLIIIASEANLPNMPAYLNDQGTYATQTHWDYTAMKDCALAGKDPKTKMFYDVNLNPEVSIPSNTIAGKVIQGGRKVLNSLNIPLKGTAEKIEATDYKKINSQKNIKDRLEQCYAKHGVSPNIISTDFANVGDLKEFIKALNDAKAQKFAP